MKVPSTIVLQNWNFDHGFDAYQSRALRNAGQSIHEFITPDQFAKYKKIALQKGFLLVSSSPLTRSSYHADEDFQALKQNRIKQAKEHTIVIVINSSNNKGERETKRKEQKKMKNEFHFHF